MLFDENGILCIDELVSARPSFQKIMEDGIITNEEMEEQSDLVLSILNRIEKTFSPEQVREVEELLVEMSVLYAAHQHKEIQDIHR